METSSLDGIRSPTEQTARGIWDAIESSVLITSEKRRFMIVLVGLKSGWLDMDGSGWIHFVKHKTTTTTTNGEISSELVFGRARVTD